MEICNNDSPSKLLSLPAELRDYIYQCCLDNSPRLATKLPVPVEPPLCFVSKQIRAETIPIYYSSYTLPIQTFIRCSYHGQIWLRTEKFYHNISVAKFQYIERFVYYFALIDRYTGERVPIEFYLDLLPRTGSYTLRQSFPLNWLRNPHRLGDPADFAELIDIIRRHLSSNMDILLEHPGIGNLTPKHLDLLTSIDPDSLPLRTTG